MTEDFPPQWMIDQLEPKVCQAAFKNVPLEHSNHYFEAFRKTLLERVHALIRASRKEFPSIEDMAKSRRKNF